MYLDFGWHTCKKVAEELGKDVLCSGGPFIGKQHTGKLPAAIMHRLDSSQTAHLRFQPCNPCCVLYVFEFVYFKLSSLMGNNLLDHNHLCEG